MEGRGYSGRAVKGDEEREGRGERKERKGERKEGEGEE